MGGVNDWVSDKWSASKAGCVRMCLRKFFMKYVMKMREDASVAMLFGRGVHSGMETDAYAKLRGEALKIPELVDAGAAEYQAGEQKDGLKGDVDAFVEEFAEQLDKAQARGLLDYAPVPGSIEGAFQIEATVGDTENGFDPVLIEGYTDVAIVTEEGKRRIRDYKTCARPVSDKEVQEHGQLTLEAIGAEAEEGEIVSFVRYGKQKPTAKASKPVVITEQRTARALKELAEAIHAGRRAIKTGDFPKCDPKAFYCNHGKSCAFGYVCYPAEVTDLKDYIQVTKITPVGELPVADWRASTAGQKEAQRKEQV